MVLSSLEQDLNELKQERIDEMNHEFEKEVSDMESSIEQTKQEFISKMSSQKESIVSLYSTSKLSSAKREAKQIELEAKSHERKKIIDEITTELSKDFEKIAQNILTKATKVLGCTLKTLKVVCNEKDSKTFSKIISTNQIETKSTFQRYTFECMYKNELVRFDLKDEITKIVERELE